MALANIAAAAIAQRLLKNAASPSRSQIQIQLQLELYIYIYVLSGVDTDAVRCEIVDKNLFWLES